MSQVNTQEVKVQAGDTIKKAKNLFSNESEGENCYYGYRNCNSCYYNGNNNVCLCKEQTENAKEYQNKIKRHF